MKNFISMRLCQFCEHVQKQALMIATVIAVSVHALASTASADWPTDPESPLIIGQTESFFSSPILSVVSTDDDAVWVAWSDKICGLGEGAVRIQRIGLDGTQLVPNGIAFQEDPGCASQSPPILEAFGLDVVVSRNNSSPEEQPVERFDLMGEQVWFDGFSTSTVRTLVGVAEFDNGDALIVTRGFREIHADRVDPSGSTVWPKQATVATSVANIHVFGIVPDSAGGAYIFWDSFLSYTKLIFAMRIDSNGETMWDQPVRLVEPPPGIPSSRHSDPVAVSDGAGGAVVVWTRGFETGTTPAPQLMQRIGPDGSLAFGIEGVRVSLGTNRQFFADVQTDDATGDLLIVWRDGQQEQMTLNAQRMSIEGERLWGDFGVVVSPIDQIGSSFDAIWHNNQLSIIIGHSDGAEIHNVDAQGKLKQDTWTVASGAGAYDVRITQSGDGIVVVWQGDGPELNDFVAAARANPDGRLGGQSCNPADLNGDSTLNFFDVSAFLSAFIIQDSVADFTDDGLFNFFDVSFFLQLFSEGCP